MSTPFLKALQKFYKWLEIPQYDYIMLFPDCQVVFYAKFKVLPLALFNVAKLWVVIIYRIVDNSDKMCYDLW